MQVIGMFVKGVKNVDKGIQVGTGVDHFLLNLAG